MKLDIQTSEVRKLRRSDGQVRMQGARKSSKESKIKKLHGQRVKKSWS
jgi:hypothetical protein